MGEATDKLLDSESTQCKDCDKALTLGEDTPHGKVDEEKVPRLNMVVKREEAIGEIVHSQKVPILSGGQLGRVCVRHDRRLTLG